jgi:hypothetical protein
MDKTSMNYLGPAGKVKNDRRKKMVVNHFRHQLQNAFYTLDIKYKFL